MAMGRNPFFMIPALCKRYVNNLCPAGTAPTTILPDGKPRHSIGGPQKPPVGQLLWLEPKVMAPPAKLDSDAFRLHPDSRSQLSRSHSVFVHHVPPI